MALQVNKYPCQRVFNAIGTGGDDFKAKMMQAVESVVGTIHVECVSERPSSGGKYVSVRIGPVWVENADQVGALYAAAVEVVAHSVCCHAVFHVMQLASSRRLETMQLLLRSCGRVPSYGLPSGTLSVRTESCSAQQIGFWRVTNCFISKCVRWLQLGHTGQAARGKEGGEAMLPVLWVVPNVLTTSHKHKVSCAVFVSAHMQTSAVF